MINAPSYGSKVVPFVCAALLIAGVSLHSAAPGEAASSANYFLDLSGIVGEASTRTTQKHVGQIEVLNFSMNFSQSVPCGQLLIVKYIDKASPLLVRNMLTGSVLSDGVLTGETIPGGIVAARQGAPQFDYFKLILKQVRILTLAMQDNSGSPPAVENVTLSASVIRVQYTPTKGDGTPGPTVEHEINCTK